MDAEAQITKMSSRGQVVIPESIRNDMGLEAGSTFVVFGRKDADAVLLKKLVFPEPARAFEEIAEWGRAHAKAKKLEVTPTKIVETQHKER